MPLAPYTHRKRSTAAIDWSSVRWYKDEDRAKLLEICSKSRSVVFDLTFWCPTRSNDHFDHACSCLEGLRRNARLQELHVLFPRGSQSNSSSGQQELYARDLKEVAKALASVVKNHIGLTKVTVYNLHTKSSDNASTPGLMNVLRASPIVEQAPFDRSYKAIQSYNPCAWEEEDEE